MYFVSKPIWHFETIKSISYKPLRPQRARLGALAHWVSSIGSPTVCLIPRGSKAPRPGQAGSRAGLNQLCQPRLSTLLSTLHTKYMGLHTKYMVRSSPRVLHFRIKIIYTRITIILSTNNSCSHTTDSIVKNSMPSTYPQDRLPFFS